MAEGNNPFEQMFTAWQEGQQAYFKAQKEAFEEYSQNYAANAAAAAAAASAPNASAKAFEMGPEAMKNWQDFVNTWAPAWNPSAMMANQSSDNLFAMGKDALHGMVDPANWMAHAPEQLRKILDSVAQGPRFADLATPQIDAAEAWRETLDYQKAAMDFSKIMQDAWGRAFKNYSDCITGTHSVR